MLTNTDVANLALGKLGSTLRIVNLDTETTQTAKIVRTHYAMALSTILEMHPWAVYTKQAQLSLVTAKPSAKWEFAYALPVDAQVIRRLSTSSLFSDEYEYLDQMAPFEPVNSVDGYEIHTDVPGAWAEYTRRIPEGSGFIDHFARAFSAQLSMDIAPSIITNNYLKMEAGFTKRFKLEISNMIANDITLAPIPRNAESPFIRARWKN